jgi:lipoyl(octanoyl) transferase
VMEVIDLGKISYSEAQDLQLKKVSERLNEKIGDQLLLLEHPPVITFGRRDSSSDLLISENEIERRGTQVIKTDRGGKVTYHGPGQIVGYFIFKLGKKTIPTFVREIEELLIKTLADFSITGSRDCKYPGVWIGNKKIAAIGLHFERGVSRHGFALNVNCDLTPFSWINPCGIRARGVTSIEKEIESSPSLDDVKNKMTLQSEALFVA